MTLESSDQAGKNRSALAVRAEAFEQGDVPVDGPQLGIAAVERETGLAKETLRVWERRYGFPMPGRDEHGERIYRQAEIEKLRVLRRLVDSGYRPGRIVALPMADLNALSAALATRSEPQTDPQNTDVLEHYLSVLRSHRVDRFRDLLTQALMRDGLARFVTNICGPLTRRIGEAWAAGDLEIFEEHLYTESMQGVLRNAITSMPTRGQTPRVLMTTLPDEQHGLGLLMAEAILSLEGCACTSLGIQTPILDIVRAATFGGFDVVALSFSSATPQGAVIEGLRNLRSLLPATMEIWVGGMAVLRVRKLPPGVVVLADLAEIRRSVQAFRQG